MTRARRPAVPLLAPLVLALSLLASSPSPAADGGACAPGADGGASAVAGAVRSAAALTDAPGAATFAKAWTRKFAGCARRAAGRDGRLSAAEAARFADRDDACAIYGDNAVNWLLAKGQASVDLEVLIRAGYRYAFATARKAADDDGRLSYQDAGSLPADLRQDYLHLRGALGRRTGPSAAIDLAALRAATEGLIYSSENESRWVVLDPVEAPAGPITPELIREAFAEQHDVVSRDGTLWFREDAEYIGLAPRFPAASDFQEWFSYLEEPNSDHPASVEEAQRFSALRQMLEAGLTDLRVIRFKEKDQPDAVTASIFVVGRAADGRLVAILTGAVET